MPPGRKFSAYLANASRRSVSKHVIVAFGPFCFRSAAFLQPLGLAFDLGLATAVPADAWVLAQDFAFTRHARSSDPTESSSGLSSRAARSFTDRRFAFSCSPRRELPATVTFHYRPADFGSDGDFHPATLCVFTVALACRFPRTWHPGAPLRFAPV
jgi:hypothetical protein